MKLKHDDDDWHFTAIFVHTNYKYINQYAKWRVFKNIKKRQLTQDSIYWVTLQVTSGRHQI